MIAALHQIANNGAGVPVFALHSLGLNGASWHGVADHAAAGRAFYAFDQLAHGAQAARVPDGFDAFVNDAARAVHQLDVRSVHLVGHSIGGAVAARIAARLSSGPKIASLTLIATPFAGMDVFRTRAHAVHDGSMQAVIPETMARWFAEHDPQSAQNAARASLNTMQPGGFDACWTALAELRGFEDLAGSIPPTRIISFANDKSTPPDVGARIAHALKAKAALVDHHIIDGAGHMGVLTHPAQVGAHLLTHWKATDSHLQFGGAA